MSASHVLVDEFTRLLADLRARESGLSVEEADLADALDLWLIDQRERDEEKSTRRDYRDARGRKLPGVTGVIGSTLGWSKEAIARWAAKEAAAHAAQDVFGGAAVEDAIQRARFAPFTARDDKADIGTLAHVMIEAHAKGVPIEVDPFLPSSTVKAARAALAKFAASWDPTVYEVLHAELALTDQIAGYGGTIDLVLRERATGRIIIADVKTGKGVYDEQLVQVGAYCLLLSKIAGLHAHGGMLIHVPVEGERNIVPISLEMITLGAQAFAALLFVYRARKQLTLKKDGV